MPLKDDPSHRLSQFFFDFTNIIIISKGGKGAKLFL